MLSSHISSASRTVTIYLDTGASSNAVPVNSPIIYNVHDIPSREVIGIGQQECTKAGFLHHFGPALLIPSLTVHLISLSAQRARGTTIVYDQQDNCFVLNYGTEYFKFTLRENKLYGYDYPIPPTTFSSIHLKLDRLINGRYYTEEQYHRASLARIFHKRTGHDSSNYLRFALSTGTFVNCMSRHSGGYYTRRRNFRTMPRLFPREAHSITSSIFNCCQSNCYWRACLHRHRIC